MVGALSLSLQFQHLIFPIEQLSFIIRITSLKFSNNFLPSALKILSFLATFMSNVAKTLDVCQKDNIALLLLPLWESVIVLCFGIRYVMSILVLS